MPALAPGKRRERGSQIYRFFFFFKASCHKREATSKEEEGGKQGEKKNLVALSLTLPSAGQFEA